MKSNLQSKILTNKVNFKDNGYELWKISNSELFICNNLNNKSLNNRINNLYSLDLNKCSIEKLLYIKKTNKYKKITSYNDKNNNINIWRPIPQPNFCSIGDICLVKDIDPNNKLETIVVHNSLCKPPLNYGEKSLYKINNETNPNKNINFWRPKPYNNYHFFSDIVILGDEEPESDNLIYSVNIDYINKINKDTHKMIYNNLNPNNPNSIWIDNNYFVNISNNFKNCKNNKFILNESFTKSDLDMLDNKRIIVLNYTNNKNNLKNISNNDVYKLLKNNLSNKLDINHNRLQNFDINKENKTITLTIGILKSNSNELTTNEILEKLKSLLNTQSIKIYNETKDLFYFIIDDFYTVKAINTGEGGAILGKF